MAFKTAILHLALAATSTTAVRTNVDLKKEQWTVNLIIARHGVSCTNIIEKWSSWGGLDFKRGYMLDPPLAGMSDEGNQLARDALDEWSRESGNKIDAVLSSVLMRAMQTGVAMSDAKPLYVVPFLREHAGGDSNSPDSQQGQKSALEWFNSGQKVNYDFVQSPYGYAKGTWENFVEFLKKEFLPYILSELDPASQRKRTITLLVATHSKFLKEQSKALSDRCKGLWNPIDGKPFNSQVFQVKYTYSKEWESSLLPANDECREVFAGTTIYDTMGNLKPLCVADMGDRCAVKIKRYSFSPTPIIQMTMEWQVALELKAAANSNKLINDLREKLGCDKTELSRKCMERFPEKKGLARKLQGTLDEDRAISNKLFFLLSTECVGGNFPQVRELAKYEKLDLPRGAVQHSGPGWRG